MFPSCPVLRRTRFKSPRGARESQGARSVLLPARPAPALFHSEKTTNAGTRSAVQGHQHSKWDVPGGAEAEWDGKYYSVQQVAPVVAQEPDRIVVVTVYTFYF